MKSMRTMQCVLWKHTTTRRSWTSVSGAALSSTPPSNTWQKRKMQKKLPYCNPSRLVSIGNPVPFTTLCSTAIISPYSHEHVQTQERLMMEERLKRLQSAEGHRHHTSLHVPRSSEAHPHSASLPEPHAVTRHTRYVGLIEALCVCYGNRCIIAIIDTS